MGLPPPDSDDTDYAVLDSCPSEMLFDGDSKGFEGARSIRGADGVLYVLGLCEGNHCSSQTGKDVGHGKVIVMAREDEGGPTGGCYWKTVRTIDLPMKEFVDYSALAIHHRTKAVAITSQENSQVWVGELSTGSDGEFDPMTAEFSKGRSTTSRARRRARCSTATSRASNGSTTAAPTRTRLGRWSACRTR